MRYIVIQGNKEIGAVITSESFATMDFLSLHGNLHQIIGVNKLLGSSDVKIMRVSGAYEDAKY